MVSRVSRLHSNKSAAAGCRHFVVCNQLAFDDGTRATLRFPTDPGLRVGERVIFANGRLQRD